MAEEDTSKLIQQWTLANALEHDGRANTNAVIGKLIAEKPELKSKIRELKKKIEKEVSRVNDLSTEDQKSEIEEIGRPERLEKEEEEGLPELPEVDRYSTVVTRFAPNPNGPLHLGHMRAAVLSHDYARKNDGQFILRFEDTNPANANGEVYDHIREDLKWLDLNWDKEYIQSERLEIYYQYCEDLLNENNAYVCTCPPEKFKPLRDGQKACQCRNLSAEENLERWEKMLNGDFDEGDVAVRIKTNLNDPNPALRDWPAFRIVSASHPKTGKKYPVWPLYNFSVAIDDHKMGITHILRGKEHEVNEQRQRQLFEHLNWDYPTAIQYGRLSIPDAILSKTKIMKGIQKGKFEGYGDVRLGTIAAVRRRGIVPEAIREVIRDVGITRSDSTLSWNNLYTKNRRIIDEDANRYFFIPKPKKLVIRKVPNKEEARLRLHPDDPDRGKRVLPLDIENGDLNVWLPSEDAKKMKIGKTVRLKDLLNFKLLSKEPLKAEFESFEVKDVPKIQWVSKNSIEMEVLKPDGKIETGYAEPEVSWLPKGEVVQFERYGFVRIDEVEPNIRAVYGHS